MRSLGGAFGDAFLLLPDENDGPARVPLSADAGMTDVESGITDVLTDVVYDVVTILPRNASTLQVPPPPRLSLSLSLPLYVSLSLSGSDPPTPPPSLPPSPSFSLFLPLWL